MGYLIQGRLQILEQKTLNHGWHGYTRMGRRGSALWQAKRTLRFQITSQASLYGIVKPHCLLAWRVGPLLRALREILGIWGTIIQGCDWLAKREEVLGKHPKARLLVFQNSSSIRAANQPCVFRGKNWFGHIRVNP
jgi:hypothetical protein